MADTPNDASGCPTGLLRACTDSMTRFSSRLVARVAAGSAGSAGCMPPHELARDCYPRDASQAGTARRVTGVPASSCSPGRSSLAADGRRSSMGNAWLRQRQPGLAGAAAGRRQEGEMVSLARQGGLAEARRHRFGAASRAAGPAGPHRQPAAQVRAPKAEPLAKRAVYDELVLRPSGPVSRRRPPSSRRPRYPGRCRSRPASSPAAGRAWPAAGARPTNRARSGTRS